MKKYGLFIVLLAAAFRIHTAYADCQPDGATAPIDLGNDNIICSGSNDTDGVNTNAGFDTVTTAAANGNIDNSGGNGIDFLQDGIVQGDGIIDGAVGVYSNFGSVTYTGNGLIIGASGGIRASGTVVNSGSGTVTGLSGIGINVGTNAINNGSGDVLGGDIGILSDFFVTNSGSGDVSGGNIGISADFEITNSGSGDVTGGNVGISANGDVTNSGSGTVSGNVGISGGVIGQTFTLSNGTITGTGGTAVDAAGDDDVVIVEVGNVTINGSLNGNVGTDTLTLNGTTDDAAGWNFFQSCVTTPAACSGVGPFNVTANGKTFAFSNFEAFINSMTLIVAAAGGQPIDINIGGGGGSPTVSSVSEICGGAIKVFRQSNGDLDVYSGFDVLPPNGFLVGRITQTELAAGVRRFQDSGTAAELGWVVEVTLSDKLVIQVFDGQGNPIGTCTPQ